MSLCQKRVQRLTSIRETTEQAYPKSNSGKGCCPDSAARRRRRRCGATLYLLLGAVGLVLLIACANVRALCYWRRHRRAHEMPSARPSVPAGLASCDSCLRRLRARDRCRRRCLVVAVWGTRALVAIAPTQVPRLAKRDRRPRLTFTLLVCTVVSVLFSLPPPFTSRGRRERLVAGGRWTNRQWRVAAGSYTDVFVVAEIA